MHATMCLNVAGHGIAAASAALLSVEAGRATRFAAAVDPSERIVLVPRDTVELIAALTGLNIPDAIPSRWVTSRCLAWESPAWSRLPADALAFDAVALAQAMGARVVSHQGQRDWPQADAALPWMFAGGACQTLGACGVVDRVRAGTRQALGAWVPRLPGLDSATTVVACTPGAWLCATPHPASGVAVVVVHPVTGAACGADILRSAVDFLWPGYGAGIERVSERGVAAAPSHVPDCAAHGRIAIGEAAITFDPLRGDGVGHAVRGALLANSVIGAIADGESEQACLRYYRARLAHAFAVHVQTCRAYYLRAWNAHVWTDEIASMTYVLATDAATVPTAYRMQGQKLVAVHH